MDGGITFLKGHLPEVHESLGSLEIPLWISMPVASQDTQSLPMMAIFVLSWATSYGMMMRERADIRREQGRGRPEKELRDMNKYTRVIAIDVALAAVAVCLYSPGLLGLSPMDPNIVKATLGVMAGVAIVGTAGVSNTKLLKGASHVPLAIGSGTSGEESASFDDVYVVLVDYQNTRHVATYAVQGIERLDETARKSVRLKNLIDSKFEPGSLSWTRFMGVVDAVTSTITRNSAILANRIQAFDTEGYERDRKLINSNDYLYDNIPDDIQMERYGLYENSLQAMQDIINANEKLILEFDRLSSELASLDSNILTTESEEMLEEIHSIVDQTKFYAS